MSVERSPKILRTRQEIMDYIDKRLSEKVFYQLVKEGLPVQLIGGNLYAHADNIDDYFKARTRRGIGNIPEGVE